MTAIPFDTLKMMERLEKAGVPAEQARVQTDLLAEVICAEDRSISERFSSKQDVTSELVRMNFELTAFRQEIKADVSNLRREMQVQNADTKSDITRWVVSVGIFQSALLAGLVLKLLH